MNKEIFWIASILIIAFFIRIYNSSFPAFTADEARIAYRGYSLAVSGKDELGRKFPLLFNSLEDYQLPVVSYLTAGGEFLLGKSESGARLPFIVIGVLLVLLTYQIAKSFSSKPFFWITAACLVAFSPALVFLSKTPNEVIVLTFILTLLFYLLINTKKIFIISLIIILAILTSKLAWFILLPFVFVSLYYAKYLVKKEKVMLIGFTAVLVVLSFIIFLSIPQAKRSLQEHSFSLFSSVTISNGIDKLRGESIQAGWNPILGRLLFNKAQYLLVGLLHWLTNLSPNIYFGKFDGTGLASYSFIGAWSKVLIIPFGVGLISLIRNSDRKKRLILIYFLILTFPAIFIYPKVSLDLIILTLPFMVLVILFGLEQLKKKITLVILFVMIVELLVNIYFLSPEYRNTTTLRPIWIKEVASDLFERSKLSKTAVSDDIAEDTVSYIEWYAPVNRQNGYEQIPWPYKFRQYRLGDIKIIASQENFSACGKNERLDIFISKRDMEKINTLNAQIRKTYKDSNDEVVVYMVEGVCLK